jgi:hypothetical protein
MSAAAWRLFAGPVVWAAHFFAIYAATALVCARMGPAAVVVTALAGGATLVAAALLVWTIVASARDRGASPTPWQAFSRRLAMTTAGLALVAVVFETLPLLLLPPCR